MATPVAVNLPDAHMAWGTWADYPDLNRDSFCSLRQAVDHCLMLKCDLILPGDVIDKSVQDDAIVIAYIGEQLNRLWKAGIKVWFIVGQHERTRRVPWLSCLGLWNVKHVHGQSFSPTGSSLKFYGLDFQPAGLLQPALETVPSDADILVCHQVWQELMGDEARPEGALQEIPAPVRMVLTGDFHGHKTFQCQGAGGQMMKVVSSGSTHMRSLSEDPNKFFHIIYDDLSVESVKLLTRPYHRFRVYSEEQLQQVLANELQRVAPDATLPEEIRKPIVHLEFLPEMTDVRRRCLMALAGRGFLFDRMLKPRDIPVEGDAVDPERLEEMVEQGLEGCLGLEVQEGTPLYDTCLRLLKVPKHLVRQELAMIAQEWFAKPRETAL